MGQYSSYGIVHSFSISKESLNQRIRNKFFTKSLDNFGIDVITNQMPDIYDVFLDDENINFKLKESFGPNDLANLIEDFFKILPYKPYDEINELTDLIRKSDPESIYNLAKSRTFYNFVDFRLYGIWYGMRIMIDGENFYPNTDVSGFMLYQSESKTVTENPLTTYDFMSDLLRYKLNPNPMAESMICFLSQ